MDGEYIGIDWVMRSIGATASRLNEIAASLRDRDEEECANRIQAEADHLDDMIDRLEEELDY